MGNVQPYVKIDIESVNNLFGEKPKYENISKKQRTSVLTD